MQMTTNFADTSAFGWRELLEEDRAFEALVFVDMGQPVPAEFDGPDHARHMSFSPAELMEAQQVSA